jgi:energy-coupling factor transporter ATP-binding protein EcfA2
MLYAICGQSGSGKTTLLEATLQRLPSLARLTTFTTRLPRPGERDGWDYHFMDDETFQALLRQQVLVCPIRYRGCWYATAGADLARCARRDTLGILRPDQFEALAAYTPISGIYLERADQTLLTTAEDAIICAYAHRCRSRLVNHPGRLEQTTLALVRLIQRERARTLSKESYYGESHHPTSNHLSDASPAPAATLL